MPSLDIDIDINTLQAGFGSRRARPRFNSDIPTALASSTGAPIVPSPQTADSSRPGYPDYHKNWDADLRTYMYLNDFLAKEPAWLSRYKDVATACSKPPQDMTQTELNAQVLQMLDMVKERETRFAEIIDQDDAEGALNYWVGLLNIDASRHPGTNLMLRVGRRIGEHVVMCLKGTFKSPRPPQLCPVINPMIDPPVTPSFPAGHAVQSYLISYLLAYCLPNLPRHELSANLETAKGPLFDLAARVSENRIVAGIHYPCDILVGKTIAIECFKILQTVDSVWGGDENALRQQVTREFSQYAG